MRISDMLREDVELDVKGAKISYNPQRLSVADLEALDAVDENDPRAMTQALELLEKVIVRWDLEDDDGEVPVTVAGMRRLPVVVMTAVLEAVSENVLPSRAEGEASGGASSSSEPGSTTQQPEPESPNGIPSSREPVTSGSLLGNLPASPPAG